MSKGNRRCLGKESIRVVETEAERKRMYQKQILIVEDNSIDCAMLSEILQDDYHVLKAGDRLLVEEARILCKRVSEDAICCRYVADRFLCLTEKEIEKAGRKRFVEARKNSRSELTENISVKIGVYEIKDRTVPVEKNV